MGAMLKLNEIKGLLKIVVATENFRQSSRGSIASK